MQQFGIWVGAIGGLLSLVALVSVAYVVSRSAVMKQNLADYQVRTKLLEDERADDRVEIAQLKAELQVEKDARVALEKVVTSKQEIEQVLTLLSEHHDETSGTLNRIAEKVGA